MCEHLAHIALSIWQQATPPYLIVWYHSPCLTWHPLIAWLPILSSPHSVVGSAMLHPRHHPLFVSLRFSLARRQCPFLGTKYWGEPHKRTNLSLFPHSRPPYSADHHGPKPTCNGYFFVLLSTKFSVCSAPGHLTAWISLIS